jgi:hypothetical protein
VDARASTFFAFDASVSVASAALKFPTPLSLKGAFLILPQSQTAKENVMDQEAKAYRVSEFCKRYVISRASFYREIAANRLHIIKRGHTTLVTNAEAERWFAALCQPSIKPSN